MEGFLTIDERDDIVRPPAERARRARRARLLAMARGLVAVLVVVAIAVVAAEEEPSATRTLAREPVPLPVPVATDPAVEPAPGDAGARRDTTAATDRSRPAEGAQAAGARPGAVPVQITYTYTVQAAGPVTGDLEAFAEHANVTLNDPRGWALDGAIAFRRVPEGGDFTLWLAPPEEVDAWADACSAEYSCRVGRDVLINDARWTGGAEAWSGPLDAYRRYVVNHEVGHWLGFGHVDCPAPDQPAPVMHQQSKGLEGCQPQVWPDDAERGAVAERLPEPPQ